LREIIDGSCQEVLGHTARPGVDVLAYLQVEFGAMRAGTTSASMRRDHATVASLTHPFEVSQ